LALALLYEAECKQISLEEAIANQLAPPPEFTATLLQGVAANAASIDAKIQEHTQKWDIERLPKVDLALLRIGIYEVCHNQDVPVAVAIDEAVELAKQYSTQDSSRYINGVLSGVLKDQRAEAPNDGGPAQGAGPAQKANTTATANSLAAKSHSVAHRSGQLVLRDGTTFSGELFGAQPNAGFASGEVVFNTSITGYQEILTDPSYAGQIITFTYPHIGNYGITQQDTESEVQACRGIVVRHLTMRPSNWRATGTLNEQLKALGLAAISDIDTRRLTRHIRQFGSMVGAFGALTQAELLEAANAEPGTDGIDLVSQVSCAQPYIADDVLGDVSDFLGDTPDAEPRTWRIVAYDFGIKRTILRQLVSFAEVEVVPAATPYSEVLARQPHGVFLSNGPGDPRCSPELATNVENLLGELPVFGICLGHQILAQALGAEIIKLPFGHHGGNHPVANCATGEVEITAQNHNFAVASPSPSAPFEVTHLNLNDHTVEGLKAADIFAWGVQYHPEAGPGPHDSRYLFAEFRQMLEAFHKRS